MHKTSVMLFKGETSKSVKEVESFLSGELKGKKKENNHNSWEL